MRNISANGMKMTPTIITILMKVKESMAVFSIA